MVGVLDQVYGLLYPPRTQVHGQHDFDVRQGRPLDELPEPKLVGLYAVPGRVEPPRAVLAWPDPVLPAVPGDEVPPWVPDCRYPELAYELEHVGTEASLISSGVVGLVHPPVDTSAHMFYEGPKSTPVDWASRPVRINTAGRLPHGPSPGALLMMSYILPLRSRRRRPTGLPAGSRH